MRKRWGRSGPPITYQRYQRRCGPIAAAVTLSIAGLSPSAALAFDTGVSDDRVSLPEGPGSLEGVGENVSVDPNMGLMRYSVPISVPKGFDGVTPSLAISYSSGGGSTVVGMGWTMTTPSIERMTMRGVPAYDEADRFVSNGGNELVLVSDNAAAGSPAIYRNRFESDFTRYLWRDRAGGAGGYWEVQYADGRVGFFGADANGRIVPSAIESGVQGTFKFHLVEMVDVYDHRMRYQYVKDGALSLVAEISYVFTNGTPTYRVALDYEDRTDLVSDAKSGFDRILSRRLKEVQVLVRGQQLRRYGLSYQADATTGRRSRLAKVETFGSNDELYPIVHSFGYSRGLGAECESEDCGQPVLTTMVGDAGLGVAFQSGTANLVDINGDALPDLIDASSTRTSHRFFYNQLTSDGSHSFSAPAESATGDVTTFPLGSPQVQFIDVNGDGFTDLLSGGIADQKVLLNRGASDWAPVQDMPVSAALTGLDADLRFMDYDNDMDIDLLRSSVTQTFVFENNGSFGFERRDLEPIGVAFSENVQFTDMNGDGLLEIVRLQANQLQYKTNFGRGRFAREFTTLNHPFGQGDVARALVEDLDSDGYADIVVVTGNTVRYVLNRNGESFEPVRSLSQAGGRSLPNREANTTVLAADMNGNGSIDIVWVGETGSVDYLDLFPIRSHLLTRIENGIGRVTDISYQPSVIQRALSAEEGQPWVNPLPHPMVVVSRTDEYDLLTDVHDVIDYRYRDGFYDGIERQFRGYAEVVELRPGDAVQDDGRRLLSYDVGRNQPHLNGKLLFEVRESAGQVVDETTHTYGDDETCPVAEVPDNARLVALGQKPIGFPCKVAEEKVVKEGAAPDQWVTTRTRTSYSGGYGNVDALSEEGVIAVGQGSCEPCSRPEETFGAACGNQCLGDERFVERTFVSVDDTGGRWLINKVARERRFGVANNAGGHFAEDIYHYDGDAFVGLPEGQLTQGKLTRKVSRVSDAKQIDMVRQRFDRHGNAVETLDPLGAVGGPTHRRLYTYDEDGLRVRQLDVFNQDSDGSPYRLRRELQYDLLFDKVTLASSWMKVEGATAVTAPDATAYTYDSFGRVDTYLLPGGDTSAAPSVEFSFDLRSPSSRFIRRQRSEVGGTLDIETITCVDGRGRTYQTRRRLEDGKYIVDGFTLFNLRSQPVQRFQSYTSNSADCDVNPPAGVLSTTYRYDGVDRLIETTLPDDSAPGGASVLGVRFEPLRTVRLDGEDSDPASPHRDTPQIETVDGLGRPVLVERQLVGTSALTVLEYDELGHLAGYVDAEGNLKRQTYDALGRLLAIDDPNSGVTAYEYDDAGNITTRTDGRGVSVVYNYDGLNREIAKFDAANREGTLISTEYDTSSNCEFSRCPNTAGFMVLKAYPDGVDFMGYDVRRRPFSKVRVIEGRTYEIETRYDNADRMVERIYPDGRTLSFVHDDASRLVGIPGVIDDVRYNDQGLTQAWVHSNGVTDVRTYDQRLRLVGLTVTSGQAGVLESIDLLRDRVDNIVRASDSAQDALHRSKSYVYDAWYRAEEVRTDEAVNTLSFSLIDNLLEKDGVAFSYGARPGSPDRVGGNALGYDGAGCVTTGHGFAHTFDHLGRLTESRGEPGHVRSVYGGDHLRIARHVDGEVTHYVDRDFEVRDGIAVIYPRIGTSRVARLESAAYARAWLSGTAPGEDDPVTAGAAYLRRQDNERDADAWLVASARRMLAEGRPAVVSLHENEITSIVLASGASGEVLARRVFDLHGQEEAATGFVDRYGFTGQEHERHTGLIHFAHRFLSTQTGQWMSPDPAYGILKTDRLARLPEAVSRYTYVMNNPGTLVDPDGLRWKMPKIRIGGALKAIKKKLAKVFRRPVGAREGAPAAERPPGRPSPLQERAPTRRVKKVRRTRIKAKVVKGNLRNRRQAVKLRNLTFENRGTVRRPGTLRMGAFPPPDHFIVFNDGSAMEI